jgi:phage terminase small subunit
MRVLTEADNMALANLCQTYSTLVKAQEKLSEVGILYKNSQRLRDAKSAALSREQLC